MAKDTFLSQIVGAMMGRRKVSPTDEAGTSGTPIFGGYIENIERDPRLAGQERYKTASDILANVSIAAAGLRYFLNLVAVPKWSVEPANDLGDKPSDASKKVAEFIESVIDGVDTAWPRIIRRSGNYRFHGFTVQEWIAKRRDDGMIGLLDIEPRPQHTIELWDRDAQGQILGVGQRNPQNGEILYIPRSKFVYVVDDTLTDSPEGMGLYRHLIEPCTAIKKYLKLEGMGFERDLRGIPIGRAPLTELNAKVKAGVITEDQRKRMVAGLKRFLAMEAKAENTSLLIDSETYQGLTGDGNSISTQAKWGAELLTAQGTSHEELGKAISRLTEDVARILGVEGLIMGGAAAGGNRALGEDKSRNLYLAVGGAVGDIREGVQRDAIAAVCTLNGTPRELWPKLKTEDVAFKDAASIAAALRDMSTAGAVLAPDDPAIDDVRDLLGISRQPEQAIARELDLADMEREAKQKALDAPTPAPGLPKGKA